MKKGKKVLIIIGLFLTYLFITMIVHQLQNDEIWGYGFTHNIYKGLIPYKDFNMVITPFFPFIMSLPFHIFGSSMLVFHIENAILLVVITFLIYNLIKNKIYILGIPIIIFSYAIIFPGYNFLLLFLFVLLIYLEHKKSNDYLIGFIIGLSILTKQSVGVFMFLPSLYFIKDKKKFLRRLIGTITPCIVFVLYLLIQNNYKEFLDLCLFGLFDFGGKNSPVSYLGYIALIIYIIINIYLIKKNKKNINNYYALAFSSMMIPLVDLHHCIIAFIALLIVIFKDHNFTLKINTKLIFIVCFIAITFINLYRYNEGYKIIYPNDIKHFEYRFIRSDALEFNHRVLDYMNKHKDKDYVFLTSGAYYYRLITDTRITYLDLINNGNYGYNGSEKIIRDIKKRRNATYFIFEQELEDYCQTDKPSQKYVMKNAKKKGYIDIYTIYEFE